jgi:hypothetical protein
MTLIIEMRADNRGKQLKPQMVSDRRGQRGWRLEDRE